MGKIPRVRRRVRTVPTFSLHFLPSHFPLKPGKLLRLVSPLNVLGPTMAVAIDANNVVLDGNYVLYVMMLLGKKSIDVVDADGLSPEQVRVRLSTDRFRGRRDPIGRHAIACGDARDAALITRLTNGRKASVIFTDAPYNVKINGFVSGLGNARHGEFAMASGEMTKDDFTAFLAEFLAAPIPALHDGGILFVCMDWRHMGELLDAGERNGLELKNLCVWTKSNAGMGSFYRSAHELVFVFKHGEAAHQNNFELGQHSRSRSNVWPYRGVNTFGRDRMELDRAMQTPLGRVSFHDGGVNTPIFIPE